MKLVLPSHCKLLGFLIFQNSLVALIKLLPTFLNCKPPESDLKIKCTLIKSIWIINYVPCEKLLEWPVQAQPVEALRKTTVMKWYHLVFTFRVKHTLLSEIAWETNNKLYINQCMVAASWLKKKKPRKMFQKQANLTFSPNQIIPHLRQELRLPWRPHHLSVHRPGSPYNMYQSYQWWPQVTYSRS